VAAQRAHGADSALHPGALGDVEDKLGDAHHSSRHPPEGRKVIDVDAHPALGGLHHIHAIQIQPKERAHVQRQPA
jgi:hypothetical protein